MNKSRVTKERNWNLFRLRGIKANIVDIKFAHTRTMPHTIFINIIDDTTKDLSKKDVEKLIKWMGAKVRVYKTSLSIAHSNIAQATEIYREMTATMLDLKTKDNKRTEILDDE